MKISPKTLQKILVAVRPGVAKKDIVEQATHFIFTGKDIVTYNDKVSISHPFVSDFSCSVKAEEFYKIVSGITEDEVEITLDSSTMVIQSKSTRSRLSTATGEDILKLVLSLSLDSLTWENVPSNFIEGISLCMFSSSRVSKGVLSCISVKDTFMVSSDNIRVSKFQLQSGMKPFLLPVLSAVELVKFEVDGYCLTDHWVHFIDKNDVVFSSKVVIDKFLNVDDFFNFPDTEHLIFPSETGELIQSLLIMSEGDSVLDKSVTLTVDGGSLTCRSEKDLGWLEKTIPITYKGSKIEFLVNPIFFTQVLEKVNKVYIHEDRALFKMNNFSHVMALPII